MFFIDYFDTKLIKKILFSFTFLVSVYFLWMDTNKSDGHKLLLNILSMDSVSNVMQCRVRNPPENRANVLKVITDP